MTLPFKDGGEVTYEEVKRREREEANRRLREAVRRSNEGETDWQALTDMMGRNELPDLLHFVWTRLPVVLLPGGSASTTGREFLSHRSGDHR